MFSSEMVSDGGVGRHDGGGLRLPSAHPSSMRDCHTADQTVSSSSSSSSFLTVPSWGAWATQCRRGLERATPHET